MGEDSSLQATERGRRVETKWELELEGTWGIASTGSGGDAAHEVVDDKNDDGSVPVSTFGRSTTVTGRPSLSQVATTTLRRRLLPQQQHVPEVTVAKNQDVDPGNKWSSPGSTAETEMMAKNWDTARSYLGQVAAWQKMTRISPSRQGLVLYQNLSCKAWTESERLDLDLLSSGNGVAHRWSGSRSATLTSRSLRWARRCQTSSESCERSRIRASETVSGPRPDWRSVDAPCRTLPKLGCSSTG